MRRIDELLKIVLDNIEPLEFGLCDRVYAIWRLSLITESERDYLWRYIAGNRPSMLSSVSAFFMRNSGYYWTRGSIRPRIKWLKHHIRINKCLKHHIERNKS